MHVQVCRKDDIFRQRRLNHSGVGGRKIAFRRVYPARAYTTLVVLVFLGAVLEEKFAKQNGHFEEFLYSNVLVKYYRIQWILEEKIFLKKPPLLAVSFKFMT